MRHKLEVARQLAENGGMYARGKRVYCARTNRKFRIESAPRRLFDNESGIVGEFRKSDGGVPGYLFWRGVWASPYPHDFFYSTNADIDERLRIFKDPIWGEPVDPAEVERDPFQETAIEMLGIQIRLRRKHMLRRVGVVDFSDYEV